MTELRSAVDTAVLDQLRESVGDDPEFLAELVDEFLQDAPTQLETLRDATASGDTTTVRARGKLASATRTALTAFSNLVSPLSRPHALEDAFKSYFAYKAAHPDDVKKPYLYFVDFGLPNNKPRGYVFDMKALKIVDGPFTVAAGRGSRSRGPRSPARH